MGTPKGLLQLHGRSFAWHVVTALREAGCDPVLFVVRGDGSSDGDSGAASSLAAKALGAGAVVITNPDPEPGPISSLRLALDRVGPHVDFVVWLPLDHPTVRPETVAGLIAEARRSGAPVTLPVHAETRGHPAVFARAVFPELLDPELPGGARTVVHRHMDRARLVVSDDPGVLLDVDTPADYRALLADAEAPEPPPIS
jgi:CTP:molybdopterin cytidylyltransferase MocA